MQRLSALMSFQALFHVGIADTDPCGHPVLFYSGSTAQPRNNGRPFRPSLHFQYPKNYALDLSLVLHNVANLLMDLRGQKDFASLFEKRGSLHISQGGLLLEGPMSIDSKNVLISTVDMNSELIEIKGEIVNSREAESGIFQSGIHFFGSPERTRHFVVTLVKVFNLQKNK